MSHALIHETPDPECIECVKLAGAAKIRELKAEVEAADATFDDETAAHQETLLELASAREGLAESERARLALVDLIRWLINPTATDGHEALARCTLAVNATPADLAAKYVRIERVEAAMLTEWHVNRDAIEAVLAKLREVPT